MSVISRKKEATAEVLSRLLRKNGDTILDGSRTLSLTTSCLNSLHADFLLLNAEVSESSTLALGAGTFDVLPSNSATLPELVAVQYIYDFVQKTRSLKLIHGNETISGSISLSCFRSLHCVELRRTPPHLVTGIQILRPRLQKITYSRALQNLKELFGTCGGDRARPMSWLKLKFADLSFNKICQLDDSLRLLPILEHLDVSHNQIHDCETYLQYLSELKFINLAYNRLEKMPTFPYEGRQNLHTLILCNNDISSVKGVECMSCLVELDLRNNCLYHHDNLISMAMLNKLRKINLTGNPLCYHTQHRMLTFLHIHDCVIKQIQLDGKQITSKEIMDCSHQKLIRLPSATLDHWSGELSVEIVGAIGSAGRDLHDMAKFPAPKRRRTKRKVRSAQISDVDSTVEDNVSIDQKSIDATSDQNHFYDSIQERVEDARTRLGPSWLQTMATPPLSGSPLMDRARGLNADLHSSSSTNQTPAGSFTERTPTFTSTPRTTTKPRKERVKKDRNGGVCRDLNKGGSTDVKGDINDRNIIVSSDHNRDNEVGKDGGGILDHTNNNDSEKKKTTSTTDYGLETGEPLIVRVSDAQKLLSVAGDRYVLLRSLQSGNLVDVVDTSDLRIVNIEVCELEVTVTLKSSDQARQRVLVYDTDENTEMKKLREYFQNLMNLREVEDAINGDTTMTLCAVCCVDEDNANYTGSNECTCSEIYTNDTATTTSVFDGTEEGEEDEESDLYITAREESSEMTLARRSCSSQVSMATTDSDICVLSPATAAAAAAQLNDQHESDSDISVLATTTQDSLLNCTLTSNDLSPNKQFSYASADIMSTSPGSGSLTGKALTSMVSSIYENLDNPATPNTPTITVAVPDCTTGGDDTNSRDDNPEPAASGVVGSGSDAVGAGSDPVGEGSGPVGGAVVVNSRPGKKHRKKSHKSKASKPRKINADIFDFSYTDYSRIDHRLKLFLCLNFLEDDEELCLLLVCEVITTKNNEKDCLLLVTSNRLMCLQISAPLRYNNMGTNLKVAISLPLPTILTLERGLQGQSLSMYFKYENLICVIIKDCKRTDAFIKQFNEILTEHLGLGVTVETYDDIEMEKIIRSLTRELALLAGENSDTSDEQLSKFTLCTFLEEYEISLCAGLCISDNFLFLLSMNTVNEDDEQSLSFKSSDLEESALALHEELQDYYEMLNCHHIVDLIRVEIFKSNLIIKFVFMDEFTSMETTMRVKIMTEDELNVTMDNIKRPWYDNFHVDLPVVYT